MAIFISYCHKDKDFVDRLAMNLVQRKARVWVDRWELRVGDSLIDRIQAEIQESTALIVVISKAAVKSEWCKTELSAGLVRELEEKRVVVLPVVIDKCEIPLFLRRKMYADFRNGFDEGLRVILEAVAGITSDTQNRFQTRNHLSDWAVDFDVVGDSIPRFRYTLLEHSNDLPYSILTEIVVIPNPLAAMFYAGCVAADLGWYGRQAVIETLGTFADQETIQLMLDDATPHSTGFTITDREVGAAYAVHVVGRWLGKDTGGSVMVHCSDQIRQMRDQVKAGNRDLTNKEKERLKEVFESIRSTHAGTMGEGHKAETRKGHGEKSRPAGKRSKNKRSKTSRRKRA